MNSVQSQCYNKSWSSMRGCIIDTFSLSEKYKKLVLAKKEQSNKLDTMLMHFLVC